MDGEVEMEAVRHVCGCRHSSGRGYSCTAERNLSQPKPGWGHSSPARKTKAFSKTGLIVSQII